MNWYYVENGQQAGPVTQEAFDALCDSGKVTDQTLVWREGMPDWKPWGTIRTAGAPQVFGAAGGIACAGCGNSFRPEEVIRINDRFVCATCKPTYLQRVREGLVGAGEPRSGAAEATATLEDVEARDYEHDLGGYISQGWDLFKSDPGIIIGTSVLVYLCLIAASMVPFFVGYILQYILSGPLMGGLWLFYLKKLRGEQPGVGDGFSGFGPKFGQLLLAYLIPALIALVCMVPGGALVAFGFFTTEFGRTGNPLDNPAGLLLIGSGGLLVLVGMCVAIYLSTCWLFTIPLVADKGMQFWPAMGLSRKVVIKHWWMTFLVMIVLGLLSSVGALACCVGVLVTAPVAFAGFAYAYKKLFGDLTQQG